MAHNSRDIRVVVLLNADEYTAMSSNADEEGLSDSAFLRHLLACYNREQALKKLSRRASDEQMQETAQFIARQNGVVQ